MSHYLMGRIFLGADIRLLTGLHIGGKAGELSIGGIDLPVIRNPADGKPYIPGSSLKGKMRSLSEKLTGAPQNRSIGKDVWMHVAGGDKKAYPTDAEFAAASRTDYESERYGWINKVFGVPGEIPFRIPAPNRLLVRDVALTDESAKALVDARTDLPYTEVKWEAAIDRVTSAATPRQIERVPAGAVFGPMELVFSIYLPEDLLMFNNVLMALQLVEDDYLGGQGSRGSGKVQFEKLSLVCKHGPTYASSDPRTFATLAELNPTRLQAWLSEQNLFPA